MNVKIMCPDTIGFFRKLINVWANNGYDVGEIRSLSDSEYHLKRGILGRLIMRGTINVGFPIKVGKYAMKHLSDNKEIWIISNPPVFLPALAHKLSKGKPVSVINLLYDLYPEALSQAGLLRANGLLAWSIGALTTYNLRNCSATVFFGKHIQQYVESKYAPAKHAAVIPVGTDGEGFKDATLQPLAERERITLLYSGTMGYMHDIHTLLQLFRYELPENIQIRFHATGVGYARLQKEMAEVHPATQEKLIFADTLHDDAWKNTMRSAQIGIVTMARGGETVCMPSKTYSALSAGQAILSICPKASDLAKTILRHDCGWVVEPGDVSGLLELINIIARDTALLYRKRVNAFEAGHKYYDMEVVAEQWMKLFHELGRIPEKRQAF